MWRLGRTSHFACFLLFLSPVSPENLLLNDTCNPALSRTNPATHKFQSDCDDKFFCDNATRPPTCQYKACQIYIDHSVEYADGEPVPTLCPKGSFCPDAEDGCRTQLPLGSPCELDRDDECAPVAAAATSSGNGNTMYPSTICLQNVCRAVNATLGQPCTIERTEYSAISDFSFKQMFALVIRDNCVKPGLYCDPSSQTPVCQQANILGVSCSQDTMCLSMNCGPKGYCIPPPQDPTPISPLAWSATGSILVTVSAAVVSGLVFIHRRQRAARARERREYYHEQMTFRNSIMELQALVRDHSHSEDDEDDNDYKKD